MPEFEAGEEGDSTFEVVKKKSSSETVSKTSSSDSVGYSKGHIDEEGARHIKHILNNSQVQQDQKVTLETSSYVDREDGVKITKEEKEVITDRV